ncbi:hypothetical protein LINPERPRIM_LOCUS30931 [Linum perenne]
MISESASGDSWASIVGDSGTALRYVDTSSAFINGSLCIPESVIDKGLKKLKAALVAQFIGNTPPIVVITAVGNRIWGFEGEVVVSRLDDGLFLFEKFASESLAQWVVKRSWHIHHSVMILRRWKQDITPVDLAPRKIPVWVIFKKVPPALITDEGISWLASHLGDPVNNFVRNGLDMKVCLLLDPDVQEMTELSVTLKAEDPLLIAIEYPQARAYKKPQPEKQWKVVSGGKRGEEVPVEVVAEEKSAEEGLKANLPNVEVVVEEKSAEEGLDANLLKDGVAIPKAGIEDEVIIPQVVVDLGAQKTVGNETGIGKSVGGYTGGEEGISSKGADTNTFNILYDLGGETPLCVEAFPPLKADVRRVSERVKKRGSPNKK